MALKLAKRFFPLFLIFSFLLSGVSPALAAEISSDGEVADESLFESGDTEELSTEKSISDSESLSSDLSAPSSAPMALDAEENPVPYNQMKAAEVKLNIGNSSMTGAFIFSYPIAVPPGRNGMQPDLKLIYNSQSGSESNVFGYGWDINIPYIERINRKGINKLYTENYFNSSLSGELVKVSTSSSPEYGAKVESGDFLKYVYINESYWLVTDKTGKTYKFGADTAARQNDPDNASSTFKWMLEEVRDTNGNYIKYEYYKDSGQIYPQTITYTGHDSTDGVFEVNFERETRADDATSTNVGFEVATSWRVSSIETRINSQISRQYNLNYDVGDNEYRSLLSSVAMTGYDEDAATTTLPADIFYYQPKLAGWAIDGDWDIPVEFYEGADDTGVRMAEMNGDSLIDIIIGNNSNHEVYLNEGDGTGWSLASGYSFSFDFAGGGVFLADVDGDGLDDVVSAKSGLTKKVYINNGDGSGWTEDVSYSVPIDLCDSNGNDVGARLVDVNGDGLVDMVQNSQSVQGVYINDGDGTGWTQDAGWSLPAEKLDFKESRLADINGDGLIDYLYSPYSGVGKVYINKGDGSGWEHQSGYSIPLPFRGFSVSEDVGTELADINGDGLVDMFRKTSTTTYVYMNKGDGTGWSDKSATWSLPCVFGAASRLADVDGDGLVDVLYKVNDATGEVYINRPADPDLISEIDYGTGAIASMEYLNSAQYHDSSNNLLNPRNPLPLTTLYRMTIYDGLDNLSTTTYEYSGGLYYYNNELDRRFAGFQKVKVIDSVGNYTLSYYHQGDTSSSTIGEYQDDESKIGNVYRTEVYDKNGNLYAKTISRIENSDLGSGRDFVYQSRNTDFIYDGDSDHKEKASTFAYDDSYGNLVQAIDYGEVSGLDDGSFADIGTDLSSTSIAYVENTTDYVVGLPWVKTTEDQDSDKFSEFRYYYDNQSLGTVTDGNLTKEERWVEGSTYIDTEKTYDSYGLVTQDKDPRDKTTDYVYDQYHLYVASTTNALDQVTDTEFDYSSGQLKRTTDANGNTWRKVYDGLGRVLQEQQPDMSTTTKRLVVKTAYSYDDSSSPRSVEKTDYIEGEVATGEMFTETTGSNWYNFSWPYRQKITINHDYVDDDLIDFPVYIDLSMMSQDFFSSINASGTDIRITKSDGLTEMPREVVSCYKASSTGELHFKADFISSTTDTFFYIYYGNQSASDYSNSATYGRNNTWSAFRFVSHNGGVTDSTGNFTPVSNYVFPSKDGKMGGSYSFDGSNGYVTLGSDTNIIGSNPSTWNVSVWFNPFLKSGIHQIINSYDSVYWGDSTFSFDAILDDINHASHLAVDSRSVNNTTDYSWCGESSINYQWHHIVQSFDKNDSGRLFFDGVLRNSASSTSSGDYTDDGNIYIGAMRHSGFMVYYMYGLIDEVRISNTSQLSNSWIKAEYANQASTSVFYSIGNNEMGGAPGVDFKVISYVDGLDRVVQVRKQSERAESYSVKTTSFDQRGLVDVDTLPYFASTTDYSSVVPAEHLKVRYSYDPLGRTLSVVNSVGTTTISYDDWQKTVVDPEGKEKDFYYDSRGNLVQVDEHNSGETYSTGYGYDLAGNLIVIEDALDNVRNFTYDGLGRLLKSEDLHDPADSYFASTTFAYDDSGNLTSKKDDKGQDVAYAYDDLNRLTSEDYSGQSGTENAYAYDSCVNGIGRLCEATSTGVVVFYAYNNNGLVSQEEKNIKGESFVTEYEYNIQGNLSQLSYPDGSEIRYEYNIAGLPERVAQREAGGDWEYLVNEINYNPQEQVIYKDFANGTQSFDIYDPAKLYRLVNKKTVGALPAGEPLSSQSGGGELSSERLVAEGLAMTKSDRSVMLYEPQELIQEATADSQTYLVGYGEDGKRIKMTRIYSGDILDYDAKRDVYSEPVLEKKRMIGGSLESLGDKTAFLGDDGSATLMNAGRSISLSSAGNLSEAVDVEYSLGGVFRKEAVINDLKDLGDLSDRKYYELDFKLSSPDSLDLLIGGKYLSQEKEIVSSAAADIVFADATSSAFRILPPMAWDSVSSSSGSDSIGIEIRYELKDDGIHLVKLLPVEWLIKANYPVYTDASIQYVSSSGDGHVYIDNGSTWALTHNAGSGTASYGFDEIEVGSGIYSNQWYISRGFLSFDTRSLPEDIDISSSSVSVYISSGQSQNDDTKNYYSVVRGYQSATSSLSNGDYDAIGDIIGGDVFDGSSCASLCQKGRIYLDLNSTGQSWINPSGWTELGIREGHDLEDSPLGFSGDKKNLIKFYSNDSATSTARPYLEVVYTVAEDRPSEPSALEVDGSLSPASTINATPEFSAIYNDPDSGDVAEHYRIQVSTSSGDWSNPVWDSGQTALSATTTVGDRCPGIDYAGPTLEEDRIYYWRIKFFDDESNEGYWSEGLGQFSLTAKSYLQDIYYEYDKVGNITKITDESETDAAKTLSLYYDDLDRLTFAVARDIPGGQSYSRGYGYDALGNIVSSSEMVANAAWYNHNWGYRLKISTSHGYLDDDLQLFPVYVDLSTLGSDFFDNVNDHGADIRITKADGITELPIEVVSISTSTETGELHFLSDSVSSTTDTDFYIYYGNPGASAYANNATYGRNAVWSGYRFVSHDGGITDSAGNFTSTNTGTTATSSGKMGSGRVFNGTSNYITIGTDSNIFGSNPGKWEMSTWVKMTDKNEYHSILSAYSSTGGDATYPGEIMFDDRSTNDDFGVDSRASGATTNYGWTQGSGIHNAWHLLSLSFDKSKSARFYYDGQRQGTASSSSSGDYTDGGSLYAGAFKYNNKMYYFLKGVLDEVRVATGTQFSAARQRAEYYDQSAPSSFLSVGDEELYTPSTTIETLYVYNGTQGSSFANPNAATAIGSNTQTYDNNGNLTSDGAWAHTWDYRDRLIQSTDGTSTIRYRYDDGVSRIQYFDGQSTTTYLNQYFSYNGATTTKNIYLGSQLIATIIADGHSTTTTYVHPDHLGGTNVVTDQNGTMTQLLDYYPFGEVRLNERWDKNDQKKKFTGHEYDEATDLNYMRVRYQSGNQGRFISQDPVVKLIGNSAAIKSKTGMSVQAYLANPQGLNGYVYANNNPVVNIDRDGNTSLSVLLFNPQKTMAQIAFWKAGIKTYLLPKGYAIASAFLNHSLAINLGNRSSDLNINSSNDNLGVIDKIQLTNEYQSKIQSAIDKYGADTNHFEHEYKDNDSVKFESDGDLNYALHGTKSTKVTGAYVDGAWQINVVITDIYDYDASAQYSNDLVGTIANNAAVVSQSAGVISNYNIKIIMPTQTVQKKK